MTLTYPPGPHDCEHAPLCSRATGCHDGTVPSSWATLKEERGGVWLGFAWRHPRLATIHRSEQGEPLDGAPRYARKAE